MTKRNADEGMPMEYKTVSFEVKDLTASGEISGYAAVFSNVDNGGDVILPKAFNNYITKSRTSGLKPKMLWQHDPSQPIGVWETLRVDEKGLFMAGRILSEVAKGREAIALLRAKALDGLSIGYKTKKSDFKENGLGMIREIAEADVWEASVVTFPMNDEARVTDVKQLQTPRDVERLLRKAGVPGGFAKLVSLHGFEEATNRLRQDSDTGDGTKAREAELITALQHQLQGLKEIFNA